MARKRMTNNPKKVRKRMKKNRKSKNFAFDIFRVPFEKKVAFTE